MAVLLNKTVKLPRINVYSLKEECQEYKKFKYCQENGEFDITEREFQEALDNYKKELDNIDDDNKLNNNFFIKPIPFFLYLQTFCL